MKTLSILFLSCLLSSCATPVTQKDSLDQVLDKLTLSMLAE